MEATAMFCLADLEVHARQVLDKNALNYYSSGADHEQSVRDNVEAFKRYRLRPRMLRDVSQVDMRVKLLGEWVEFPICVAPTAMQCMAHPEGEAATARACSKMGTTMVLSSWSTTNIEDVAKASGAGLRWFQLYVYRNKAFTRELISRAERAGYRAIVLTVDTPILGKRLADTRNRFNLPDHLSLANFTHETEGSALIVKEHSSGLHQYTAKLIDPCLTWETVDWLCDITKLPVLLKGILTAEDALEAVKHDIKGIIVSNHGGRQLDGVPATIDVLPEVVRAVNGKVEVFMDGGVRQGTDVLKALAMGAKAVFVGRPVLWGLAYKGSEGVEQVLQILKDEFKLAMMLSGCAKVSDITPELVVHDSYYTLTKSRL